MEKTIPGAKQWAQNQELPEFFCPLHTYSYSFLFLAVPCGM